MIDNIQDKYEKAVDVFGKIGDPSSRENFITIGFSFANRFVDKRKLRRKLNGAGIGKSATQYPPRIAFYSTIVGIAGLIVAIALIPIIITLIKPFVNIPDSVDFTIPFSIPFAIPFDAPFSTPDFVYDILYGAWDLLVANAVLIIQVIGGFTVAFIISAVFFAIAIYYPSYVMGERSRKIEKYYSITTIYLFGLTKGGQSIQNAFNSLRESESVFHEVSTEADILIRRMKVRNIDFLKVLRLQAEQTPNEHMEDMYLDLASVIEQGSSISEYLEELSIRADELEAEKREQSFQLMEILSEVLMIIIITPALLMIVGFAGAMIGGGVNGITDIAVVIPVALVVIFGSLIYGLFSESDPPIGELQNHIPQSYSDIDYPEQLRGWELARQLRENMITFESFKQNPFLTLPITVPVTIAYMVIANPLRASEMLFTDYVTVGLIYLWIPLVLLFAPYMILYELKQRKIKKVRTQIRPILRDVKESNKRGMRIPEAFKAASAEENNRLEKTIQKHFTTRDHITPILTRHAFERIGNEYNSDRISVIFKILSDATRETGDVSDVLERLIDNLERKEKGDREQKQQGVMYSVVMLFTSLITVGILFALDIQFISAIGDVVEQAGDTRAGLGFGDVPIQESKARLFYISYNTMFAVGTLMGLLISRTVSSTLKFIMVLTAIPIVLFFFVV